MKLGWWDQLMRTQNGPVNLHAANMEADAQQAMGIAQSGDMQFALYSSNVICLDEDRDKLHEAARLIMKTIQNIGFSCRLEDVNAIEAWRGSLPGDGYSNVRRVPLHTLNLADMLPMSVAVRKAAKMAAKWRRARSELFPLDGKVCYRTARSGQGRAVAGRGVANP